MFKTPSGITLMDSFLVVADTGNHLIRVVNKNNGETVTVAGTANTQGTTDGIGLSSLFSYPLGIAKEGEFLFIADTYNHTIRVLFTQSGEVITLAGKAGEKGSANGSLADARVSELGNDLIRVIDLVQGTVNTIAGTSQVVGSSDGPPGIGKFNSPSGLAMAGDYLYVADMKNNTIRSVNISTGEIATIAGAPLYTGATDDSGDNSRFSTPGGITMDGSNLYIADTFNHTIRKVDAETGEVTTLESS